MSTTQIHFNGSVKNVDWSLTTSGQLVMTLACKLLSDEKSWTEWYNEATFEMYWSNSKN